MRQPTSQLITFKGEDNTSGNALVVPGEQTVMLVLQHLPILPEGQSYQLWTLVDGKKIPTGQFKAAPDKTACVKIPLVTAQPFQGSAISIESVPNPSQPTGQIVLTSQQSI